MAVLSVISHSSTPFSFSLLRFLLNESNEHFCHATVCYSITWVLPNVYVLTYCIGIVKCFLDIVVFSAMSIFFILNIYTIKVFKIL